MPARTASTVAGSSVTDISLSRATQSSISTGTGTGSSATVSNARPASRSHWLATCLNSRSAPGASPVTRLTRRGLARAISVGRASWRRRLVTAARSLADSRRWPVAPISRCPSSCSGRRVSQVSRLIRTIVVSRCRAG